MIVRRGFAEMVLGGLALTVLFGCGERENSDQWAEVRYRLSVEVETPEGVRSGSSVWRFALSRPAVALASPYSPKFAGEAVAVDLSGGRTLFALVKNQEMLPERYFRQFNAGDGGDRIANIRSIASRKGKKYQLRCRLGGENAQSAEATKPEHDCPIMVTFKDINDPISVMLVDPNDLAASFGKGYQLKAITVEVTDEVVTTGIEKRLGWLSEYPEPRLDPNYKGSSNPSLSQQLSHGDFKGSLSE